MWSQIAKELQEQKHLFQTSSAAMLASHAAAPSLDVAGASSHLWQNRLFEIVGLAMGEAPSSKAKTAAGDQVANISQVDLGPCNHFAMPSSPVEVEHHALLAPTQGHDSIRAGLSSGIF